MDSLGREEPGAGPQSALFTFRVFPTEASLLSPPCRDEADEFVEIGALNGIFVLGRSMGFIGER